MPEQNAYDRLSTETALVLFCDLQTQTISHSGTATPEGIRSSAAALFKLAQVFSVPVLLSVVPVGGDAAELIEGLKADDQAIQIQRTTASLFQDAPTAQAIAQSSRKCLIVAGFMMEAVVLATVLDARAQGYDVVVAVDACGSGSPRTEQAVMQQMQTAGAVLTSVVSIGVRFAPDFGTAAGLQMFQIVQAIRAS